ncbi:flagellar hook assembly protein FlgD [Sporomusa sp. KB1]|jgi:flagellar basal-body rod modification protein FlgD|uniref:flagellar hook assembly protein FlgD n=1 Tax=Sporomusa sp. KB1 TaxID=943346 RepID=UPI0011A03ADF|nr:flagellar hook assembly protein FlgD [Sporomusa sp. KB1]TWH48601.1 flagellar basal-body rod modification protein FlgD [Sporomusa sp. KB1]
MATTYSVAGNSQSSATTNTTTTQKTSDTLGKDDFLKLLITQLQYQDPMNPMEDKEFISQMAQFTSLEQMKNLNSSMQMTQASSLIGMKVTWTNSSNAEVKTGVVNSVRLVNGEPKLVIGSDSIELSKITGVEFPTTVSTNA